MSREEAELSVKSLHTNVTGARKGDIIIGIHNMNKNSMIRIASDVLPPSKKDLDLIREYDDLWSTFITKLGKFDFFKPLTNSEREKWLKKNQKQGEFDFAEVKGLLFEMLEVGTGKFLLLEDNQITKILSTPLTAYDIRDMFPRKPGSRASRHTLVFLNHLWKIYSDYKEVNRYEGIIYNSETLQLGRLKVSNKNVLVFNNPSFGFVNYSRSSVNYERLLLKKFPNNSSDDYQQIIDKCSSFTPAGYKSLLQKIIRYTPSTILNLPSDFVLCTVFTILMQHPGSFVPDIQRYVSGQESAFKRLAVSIFEDSYIEKYKNLLYLLVLAYVSQRAKNWKPSEFEFEICLDICINTVNNKNYFVWDLHKGSLLRAHKFDIDNTVLENCSVFLDTIKSFETDLFMVRYIAKHEGKHKQREFVKPETMDITHCIDQHWAPEIVYFLPSTIIDEYCDESSKPFHRLFKNIFWQVTGVNPRKKDVPDPDYFIKEIKKAQQHVFTAKSTLEFEQMNPIDIEPFILTSKLGIEWLAGLVGPIHISGRPTTIVTLRPENPLELVVIKQPSRGMKDGTLSDERIELSIISARDMLYDGIDLNDKIIPLKPLSGYKVVLTENDEGDEEYVFVKRRKVLTWEEFSDINLKVKFLENVRFNYKNVLTYRGMGLQINSFDKLDNILDLYTTNDLQRLMSYLTSSRVEINIARISKDGGGTAETTVKEDVAACQLMLYISFLFPLAMTRVIGYVSKFKVTNMPLLWAIRDHIKNKLNKYIAYKQWKPFEDKSGRKIRKYQMECLKEMINRYESASKGHFLWLTVGLGKTLIVLEYIKFLNEHKKLPRYVVYTLPKSALESIINEINFFKLPINLLVPIGAWKKHPNAKYIKEPREILSYHINIIEHDHMRRMQDELLLYANQTLFIIDEVHKALNDTKRTSLALEISRLSVDFVALTGTPIIDNDTHKLIWWLEQIVEFPVTDENFWVAANAMISRKINTGVVVKDIEIIAEMNEKQQKKYADLISPEMGGNNERPSHKDIMDAFNLCYDVCDIEMITKTIELLDVKPRKSLSNGVFLVARNIKHQEKLAGMLVKQGVKRKDISILSKDNTIYLTDDTAGDTEKDYKVVITTIRLTEGYTLTRFHNMITSVYPSNQASREQLRGRINRINQNSKMVYYYTVHTGILTYVLQHHNSAASLSAVLSAIVKEV